MINLSIIFAFFTLYYIVNYRRLLEPPHVRVYKWKIQIYSDIVYYISEFSYYIWVVVLLFFNLSAALTLISLFLFRLIIYSNKESRHIWYQILKIIALVAIYKLNLFR
jgi:hypothetical protein